MAPSLFPGNQNTARKQVKLGPLPEDPPKVMGEPVTQRTDDGEYMTFDVNPMLDDVVPRRTAHESFKVIKDLLTRRFNDVERMFYELDEINSMRLSQEQMFQLLRR